MVAHVSAILLPSIIIYYAVAEFNLFSWHPTLMVLGLATSAGSRCDLFGLSWASQWVYSSMDLLLFILAMCYNCSLLMLEAIVIFSKQSTFFPSMSRTTKASIHYWLAGIGVSCVLAGLATIYFFKERMGKSHYTTWHGTFGAVTGSFLCVQVLGGVAVKYHKYLPGMIKIKLVDMKLNHATAGLLVFTLVTITILLALQSNWVSTHIPWYLWWVCMGCVSAEALVVMNHVTSTYLPIARRKPQTSS